MHRRLHTEKLIMFVLQTERSLFILQQSNQAPAAADEVVKVKLMFSF